MFDITSNSFGDVITFLRKKLRLSQICAAKVIDRSLNPSTLNQWEEGLVFPKDDQVVRLAKAYGANACRLLALLNQSKEKRRIENKNPLPKRENKTASPVEFRGGIGGKPSQVHSRYGYNRFKTC